MGNKLKALLDAGRKLMWWFVMGEKTFPGQKG